MNLLDCLLRTRLDADSYEFSALARYNSEAARGIVHTPEWKAKMAEEQRRFDNTRGWSHLTGTGY